MSMVGLASLTAVQDSMSGHWRVDTPKRLPRLMTAAVTPAMKESAYLPGSEMITSVTAQPLYLAVHRRVLFTQTILSGMVLGVALLQHAANSIIHRGFVNSSLKLHPIA
jgi:hypothetical protein